MSDPERWSEASDAPEGFRELIKARRVVPALSADVRGRMEARIVTQSVANDRGAAGKGAARWIRIGGIGIAVLLAAFVIRRPRSTPVPESLVTADATAVAGSSVAVEPSVVAVTTAPVAVVTPPVQKLPLALVVPRIEAVAPVATEARTRRVRVEREQPRESEYARVNRVSRSVDEDPAAAYRELRALDQDVPAGNFTEERDYLLLRALIGMNRHDEARAQARSFLTHYADGIYAPRVRRLLESTP